MSQKVTYLDCAKMIDHSLLNPTYTEAYMLDGIKMSLAYNVASICIMPYYLKKCAEMCKGTTVMPSTTIGFPHGGHTTPTKVHEALEVIGDGCMELDMVVNISKVLSGDWCYVKRDVQAVVQVAHDYGRKVKVIFENVYLKDEHKIKLCEICSEVGADWVKTSTGYGGGGSTTEDLMLMRKHSAPHIGVKAAGGVRTLDRLLEVRAMGVSRAGCSQTVPMLDEAKKRFGA